MPTYFLIKLWNNGDNMKPHCKYINLFFKNIKKLNEKLVPESVLSKGTNTYAVQKIASPLR